MWSHVRHVLAAALNTTRDGAVRFGRWWWGRSARFKQVSGGAAGIVVLALVVGMTGAGRPSPTTSPGGDAEPNDHQPDAPLVEKQTIPENLKTVEKTVEKVADVGADLAGIAKAKAAQAAREMEMSRYVLRLTPRKEKEFLAEVDALSTAEWRANSRVYQPSWKRYASLKDVHDHIRAAVVDGRGPATPVRLKFAEVEEWGQKLGLRDEFGFQGRRSFGPVYEKAVDRLVRGEPLTAANVDRAVTTARETVETLRKFVRAESAYHELLVMTYPDWAGKNIASKYYPGVEAETVDEFRSKVVGQGNLLVATLYHHAERLHRTFLSNSPNREFRFEFPELTPDEQQHLKAVRAGLPTDDAGKSED